MFGVEFQNAVDELTEILPQDSSYEFILSEEGGKNIDFFNAGKKLIEECTNHTKVSMVFFG